MFFSDLAPFKPYQADSEARSYFSRLHRSWAAGDTHHNERVLRDAVGPRQKFFQRRQILEGRRRQRDGQLSDAPDQPSGVGSAENFTRRRFRRRRDCRHSDLAEVRPVLRFLDAPAVHVARLRVDDEVEATDFKDQGL